MQTSDQIEPTLKTSSSKSCLLTVFSIFLGLWGFLVAVGALFFAFVFIQSQMTNQTNLLIIALIALSGSLIIFTAFRLKKQKWYVSLGVLILVFGVNSIFDLGSLINYSTDRLVMQSISMKPTLIPGDYFFVDKLAYWSKLPQRGDIVKYTDPLTGDLYIKRVIGFQEKAFRLIQARYLLMVSYFRNRKRFHPLHAPDSGRSVNPNTLYWAIIVIILLIPEYWRTYHRRIYWGRLRTFTYHFPGPEKSPTIIPHPKIIFKWMKNFKIADFANFR